MDLDRQPSSSSRRPRSGSQLASSSAGAGAGIGRDAATPSEADVPGDGFFSMPSRAPSRMSRVSLASSSRPTSAAGAPEATNAPYESRRPSIRIRRSSVSSARQPTPDSQDAGLQRPTSRDEAQRYRPRSSSQPGSAPIPMGDVSGRSRKLRRVPPQTALPRLTEEGARPTMAELGLADDTPLPAFPSPTAEAGRERGRSLGEAGLDEIAGRPRRRSLVGRIFRPNLKRRSTGGLSSPQDAESARRDDEYHEELVDWLDIIDPEVQTLSTLTNVQNSLFVPDLGGWVNRRPTYVLSQPEPRLARPMSAAAGRESIPPPEEPTIREEDEREESEDDEEGEEALGPDPSSRIKRSNTITSRISSSHYAALPHGQTLDGWTAAEKWEMDDHVRHMLHSKRSKFKRQMKGFGQYVRRPLGFFVTLYATLITLFGLAWVLFLIGWIYVGTQQVYAIHIIDSVLVALFAIMGDGLAPFRAVDTYHMVFIARYSRIIAKAKKKALQESDNAGSGKRSPNKLQKRTTADTANKPPVIRLQGITTGMPSTTIDHDGDNNSSSAEYNTADTLGVDLEDGKSMTSTCLLDADPLTAKQRTSLEHHQKKLSKSHSFYKPHETFTHHSFPLGHLIAIIILLDFHSCLQISLGACTWGIDYHHRPFALTTVILCVSITCNLTAGLVIMFGDRKTRKKDVLELLNRQALTGDAIKKVEKKRKQGQESDSEGAS